MKALIALLLASLSLQGAVSIVTVRSSGGTYAGTRDGIQSAVNDAASSSSTDPIIIDIEAGVTYSDATDCIITLPAQSNATKLIVLRSSRIGELAENTRVSPSDAAKMPKIENACTSSVSPIIAAFGASHYVLQGLDVMYSGEGRNALGTIGIGYDSGGGKATTEANWAHTIIVDRCYLHGVATATWVLASSTHANQQGITLQGRNLTVKNTYIADVNMDAVDHGQGESRGISSDNGSVLKIINNRIPGAIGSITGGGWVPITGMLITYSRYFGNLYEPEPDSIHWEEFDTTDTLDTGQACITGAFFQQKVSPSNKWKCVGGAWTSSSDTRLNRGWVKNAWECKNCRDVLVEGNYLRNVAQTGDQSQRGHCFLLNHVDTADYAYHSRPSSVGIRFNRCDKVGQGFVTSWGGNSAEVYAHMRDIAFEHNVVTGVLAPEINPTQGGGLYYTDSAGGNQAYSTGVRYGLAIRKNTFLHGQTFGGATLSLNDADDYGDSQVTIQDNIMGWASVGFRGNNSSTETCSFFNGLLGPGSIWNNIGLIDHNSRGSTQFNSIYGAGGCPNAITRAADVAAVKFAGASDYRLCTGTDTPASGCTTSPWATSASDGGPLGADAAQVALLSDDALAGTYDPTKYNVKIKYASSTEVRYVAREAGGTCVLTIKTPTGTLIDSITDTASLGTLERTWAPTISTNGEYWVRASCSNTAGSSSVWRERQIIRVL